MPKNDLAKKTSVKRKRKNIPPGRLSSENNIKVAPIARGESKTKSNT